MLVINFESGLFNAVTRIQVTIINTAMNTAASGHVIARQCSSEPRTRPRHSRASRLRFRQQPRSSVCAESRGGNRGTTRCPCPHPGSGRSRFRRAELQAAHRARAVSWFLPFAVEVSALEFLPAVRTELQLGFDVANDRQLVAGGNGPA